MDAKVDISGWPSQPTFPERLAGNAITARDYFAVEAIGWCLMNAKGGKDTERVDVAAKWAYKIADAMIAARGEGGR